MMIRAKLGTVPATLWMRGRTPPKVGKKVSVYRHPPPFKYQKSEQVRVDRIDEEIGMYFLSLV